MRKSTGTLMVLVAVLAVAGCSREEQEQDAHTTADRGQLPADNVFSDQVKTLDKAEGVQQTLDAAAAKQREEIERQEQR
ncbi:MAG: lipoprotein [Gammaproteobacteria bacterium]|nr:lipoprotein [Gammaproteobacteria bacterium]